MSVTIASTTKTMTADELLGLADDGIDREIIRGELRERPMTRRSRVHSHVEANVVHLLKLWLETQPAPRGQVHSGEAGFRLPTVPETLVGIDVAFVSAELARDADPKLAFYDGAPVLAVEILSPSDNHEDIVKKVGAYREVGTVAWVVDPDFRTVTVHRPGQEPEAYDVRQELSGETYLPGFRVPLIQLFEG